MKKYILLFCLSLFFVSCSRNVTPKEKNPSIPYNVLLKAKNYSENNKDTLSNCIFYQMEYKDIIYQFNVAHKQTELINSIEAINSVGAIIWFGVMIGVLFTVLFIKAVK